MKDQYKKKFGIQLYGTQSQISYNNNLTKIYICYQNKKRLLITIR